jgi:hypothetical protein
MTTRPAMIGCALRSPERMRSTAALSAGRRPVPWRSPLVEQTDPNGGAGGV